nr:type II toxin-antitoxin system VapC family toxin [uncultured Pseudomonas sp.]
MIVYLDTNIFSRITDLKISDETALAYQKISEDSEIKLVTSAKTKSEFQGTPNKARASMLLFLFSLFEKVPMEVSSYSGAINSAPLGMCTLNGGWTHPRLIALRKIFDSDDAMHIFQAQQSKCNYFLTLDEKTILSRVRLNQELVSSICPGLKFCSPVELSQILVIGA